MSLTESNAESVYASALGRRACLLGPKMPPLKPCVRAALGAAALAMAGGLQAAGLFLPVGTADGAVDVAPAVKSASVRRSVPAVPDAWERRVGIARWELTTARQDIESTGAGRLLLNVRDGVRLDVVVERTAATRWGYSLSGRVVGKHVGFVTLVVHEEAVSGSIWTPDSEYEVSYLGGGIHALREVTNAPAECAGALPSGLSATDATAQGGTDDGSVVDILVVWTPEAEGEYGGGEPQVLSRIDMLIAYANDALERSGAFVSLNLVGAEKVDYLEVDSKTDLERLVKDNDGHMDSVHDRRDILGADLVYLLTRRGGGRAVLNRSFGVGGGHTRTFAHEVGHNFGIQHERSEPIARIAVYQHGFTMKGCSGHTIMSYGMECDRVARTLPFYASPWRYSLSHGRALGVTRTSKERGARGPADAVLTLNRNRHRVANYRPGRNGE